MRRLINRLPDNVRMSKQQFFKAVFGNTTPDAVFKEELYNFFVKKSKDDFIRTNDLIAAVDALLAPDYLTQKKKNFSTMEHITLFIEKLKGNVAEQYYDENLFSVIDSVSNLNYAQAEHLYQFFKPLCDIHNTRMSEEVFIANCKGILSDELIRKMFKSFNRINNGELDFIEFAFGISSIITENFIESLKGIGRFYLVNDEITEEGMEAFYNDIKLYGRKYTIDPSQSLDVHLLVLDASQKEKEPYVKSFIAMIAANIFVTTGCALDIKAESCDMIKLYHSYIKRIPSTEVYIVSTEFLGKFLAHITLEDAVLPKVNCYKQIVYKPNMKKEELDCVNKFSMLGHRLGENLIEGVNIEFVDRFLFNRLKVECGNELPVITRFVDSEGRIELYPPIVTICRYVQQDKSYWVKEITETIYPSELPLKYLKDHVTPLLFKELMGDPNHKLLTRMWMLGDNKFIIENEQRCLKDFNEVHIPVRILFESRGSDNVWEREACQMDVLKFNKQVPLNPEKRKFKGEGIVGFHNMGNTCYMNSVLQCLIHIDVLADEIIHLYMALGKDAASRDRAYLTFEFAHLLLHLYYEEFKYYAPSTLKSTINRMFPDFDNSHQHCASEFLGVFLNKLNDECKELAAVLHTPLNTLKYLPECPANDHWTEFMRRENSVISQNFLGQAESTLTCLDCGDVCNRYEEFNILQLPHPQEEKLLIQVTFVDRRNLVGTDYCWRLTFDQTMGDLLNMLSEEVQVPAKRLYLVIMDDKHNLYLEYSSKLNNPNQTFRALDEWQKELEDKKLLALVCEPLKEGEHRIFTMNRTIQYSENYIVKGVEGIVPECFNFPMTMNVFPGKTKGEEIYVFVDDIIKTFKQKADTSNRASMEVDRSKERPYTLCIVDQSFSWCPSCKWNELCRGCQIKPNYVCDLLSQYIAIVWKSPALHIFYHSIIPTVVKVGDNVTDAHAEHYRKRNIEDLYNEYKKVEMLEDGFKCEKCSVAGSTQKRSKSMKVIREPNVLIISICRQRLVDGGKKVLKIMDYIDTPLEDFQLNEGESVYSLSGIVEHEGSSTAGHYIAITKIGRKWYRFDDSIVTEITPSSFNPDKSYLLFYLKQVKELTGVESKYLSHTIDDPHFDES
uniref:USP domain-containing protein n=1 Tax=Rhabditophanes sp. KR3021 TaxID=114890 RepID=A0AC35TI53_9BILA